MDVISKKLKLQVFCLLNEKIVITGQPITKFSGNYLSPLLKLKSGLSDAGEYCYDVGAYMVIWDIAQYKNYSGEINIDMTINLVPQE